MIKLIIIPAFLAFLILCSSAWSKDVEIKQYPLKICPSEKNYRWNVQTVMKKAQMKVFCSSKMPRPLNELLDQGSKCELQASKIICSGKGQLAHICLGVPKTSAWRLHFKSGDRCAKKALHPLTDYVPKNYNCQVNYQGILCLPEGFDNSLFFVKKKPKVIPKDLSCPYGADALAEIDKVFCFYREKVSGCKSDQKEDFYQNKRVCKKLQSYYVHVWFFKN